MTQYSISPASNRGYTWPSPAGIPQPPQPTLDSVSGDPSSPYNYSTSPSPNSFPPSPRVTASTPRCSLPLVNVTSTVTNNPYSSALLESIGLEDLTLNTQQYGPTVSEQSKAQATRTFSLHNMASSPTGRQWQYSAMHAPNGSDLVHPYQHHGDSRSLSHWHPYNRQQSVVTYTQVSLEDCEVRQLSASPSPHLSSPVSTHDSPTWLPTSQHRRTASPGFSLADGLDRRFSEGDLVGTFVPDFSFFSSESSSPTSPPHIVGSYHSTGSLESHCDSASPNGPSIKVAESGSTSSLTGTLGVYKCEYEGCRKSFSRPYNLSSHIRTHTNLRPFQCSHCDRQFARLHDKNRHERLHRGVRPFGCERCQHHFARMDALNRHLKVEGGRNLCNMFLIEKKSPNAMPIVDLPPKKINPLILAHFPNFGKPSSDES